MKKIYTMLFLIVIGASYGQTPEQVQWITSHYDMPQLENLADSLETVVTNRRQYALTQAAIKGWPVIKSYPDGEKGVLVFVDDSGAPVYAKSTNADAAISTRTDYLHSGGGLGLDIEGENMTLYVWEVSTPDITHPEFGGRITLGGDTTMPISNHPNRVLGTALALGLDPAARGMMPHENAGAIVFTSANDLDEAADQFENGMLVSNHSYMNTMDGGLIHPTNIGGYRVIPREWDELLFETPYYLMVCAAGNDGTNMNWIPMAPGYDNLLYFACAKNVLTVASAEDAEIDANGNLVNTDISSFSSVGPTDDLRIKPDIAGNGQGLYTASHTAPYATDSGTSFACPNVSATLLLLQEYMFKLYDAFMTAATLKGLALHTADDMSDGATMLVGPDAVSGWGLLNAKRAAEAIRDIGSYSIIDERGITNTGTGSSYSVTVLSNGSDPLQASVSWTDMQGATQPLANTNDNTPRLVYDLDLRITQDTDTFFPWSLTSASANSNLTDNARDPFERVDVENAAGYYTITVTHKGTPIPAVGLNYSLIITGITLCSAEEENLTIVDPYLAGEVVHEHVIETVTASNIISADADVHYRAGDFIFMTTGFYAAEGSLFLADIGGCSGIFEPDFEGTGFRRPMNQDIATMSDAGMMLKVYPNPADTSVTLALQEGTMARIILSSMDGKPVFDREASGISQKIDISSLQAGLYIVTVESASGEKYNEKLIVN